MFLPRLFCFQKTSDNFNAEAGRVVGKRMIMQYEKAMRLQEDWGNKYCPHPSFQKEYYLSSQTGDHICTQCGKIFTSQEKDEIESHRKFLAINQ